MLEANKSLWFEKIFSIYNRNLIKRRFNSLRVADFENFRERDLKIPLIVYANHSSWWDGLIAFEISRLAKLDFFIMMEEKQLKLMPLFRKLGAFSVVRESPFQAGKSLKYAVKLLTEKSSRTLWIFPQGEILPNDTRPLSIYGGLEKIVARIGHCQILPIALSYDFLGNFKPEITVGIGKMQLLNVSAFPNKSLVNGKLAKNLTENLDKIKSDLLNSVFTNYSNMI